MERRYRLQGKSRFLAIREHGRRWVHALLILGAVPNHLDSTRCGFVVSGKLGTAVTRNRIRRRLRAAVHQSYRHIAPGWDLVWIARPPIRQADFGQITAAVEGLLRQASLWQAPQESGHA